MQRPNDSYGGGTHTDAGKARGYREIDARGQREIGERFRVSFEDDRGVGIRDMVRLRYPPLRKLRLELRGIPDLDLRLNDDVEVGVQGRHDEWQRWAVGDGYIDPIIGDWCQLVGSPRLEAPDGSSF